MNGRTVRVALLIAIVIAAVLVGRAIRRDRGGNDPGWEHLAYPDDPDRRVRFVCCDSHGYYSPGVYARGGGGQWALDTVRRATPFLRAGDPDSAAAGLCGFLFKEIGYQGDTGGTLTLEPPPRPGPDGEVNWKAYGADDDVILINVDKGTAECCFGTILDEEVRDLPLGANSRPRLKQRLPQLAPEPANW